ncbi:hypothetical protein P378_10985 [Desulforamulus profundi]|uniref:Uncharacterized protein n=1 Tax=Desulforamulus profundi TaxID=1383067 RepID=A0A2C6ME00_9FIRM|nr:hypothetical protein P378_10985 [Desulforamulus profundi]
MQSMYAPLRQYEAPGVLSILNEEILYNLANDF